MPKADSYIHGTEPAEQRRLAVLNRMTNDAFVRFLNVGTGEETSIREFAYFIKEIVGYRGEIRFDPSRPDGMPRKVLDSTALAALGWRAETPLRQGLRAAYADFLAGGGRNRS